MVGVAGRSKACHTCKKRRVKCDEEKPACARCLKAGYKCAGYERALEFRNATQSTQGTISHSAPAAASDRSIKVVPNEMSLIAFKPDMQYAFLFTNFVWSTYGSPWLQLSAQGKLGVLSQQACSAFSQVIFGRHHARPDLELDGAERYGQAVSKVRWGLANPSNPTFGDLLVPVLIFLLYSSSSADRAESQSHVMGLFTLLQVAGPRAFQRPPLRMAFSSCRATLMTVGLLQRMRLFLEDEKWKTEPWALSPNSKNPQDELVDILIHVPGFLQDQKALQSNPDGSLQRALIQRVMQQLGILFAWRWRYEADNPRSATELTKTNGDAHGMPLRSEAVKPLHFRSFSIAVEISLYNAVLICLLGLLFSELSVQHAQMAINKVAANTDRSARRQAESCLRLPEVGSVTMRAAAIEILRSFEYQQDHVRESEGAPALFWLFPLGLASKVLRRDHDLSLWIQQMLTVSMVTRGYGRGDNAFGFGFYELPDVDETGWEIALGQT